MINDNSKKMLFQFLFQDYLELNGFFIHLFFFSDIYFLFIIYQVAIL